MAGHNEQRPTVRILTTGGTIASAGDARAKPAEYELARCSGSALVAAVPELADYARIETDEVLNIASQDITGDDWLALAQRVNGLFAQDPDLAGIVVTHGTNTLEETAYFLNLVVDDVRPVVLVGAQRPPTALSPDGPMNLTSAVRVAATHAARGNGVLVVMNDEIHAAREVTKTNTLRLHTFASSGTGPLGFADSDRVCFYARSARRHTSASEFAVAELEHLPAVEIVFSYAFQSNVALQALVDAGVAGIVVAGTGNGAVPEATGTVLDGLDAWPAERRPVVVFSSRTGAGRVVSRGTGDTRIRADNLNPQKARVLLSLALTVTRDPVGVQRIFDEY